LKVNFYGTIAFKSFHHTNMKTSYFAILFLIALNSFACNGGSDTGDANIDSSLVARDALSSALQKGKIISKVICKADPSKSYALYIPEVNGNQPLPVVYFFDPHGDGLLPVKKYQSFADSFHFILAGSNKSKNGNDFNDARNIFEAMNADVPGRTAVDATRIYLCGFSGGAKVAIFLGLHFPQIKGVIANGAGLEDIATARDVAFSFTAVTGNGDLNMTDLVSIDKMLDQTPVRHRIIFFDGIHEWAPESTMGIAFAGWQLDAMRNKSISKDTSFVNGFVATMKKMIEQSQTKSEWIKAHENSKLAAALLDGITDETGWFVKKENSIEHSAAFQKEENERQSVLQKEGNIKAIFQQRFLDADQNYWAATINDVKEKAKGKNAEGQMYQRLQAYLSLAFYSISNQMINKDQDKPAAYFVSLYKLADPTNSEAWYFSAILDARNRDAARAKEDLQKAVALGFNDKKRLELQPEFSDEAINLNEIEKMMK